MNDVRVRIAPSPTGNLHIGNLRSMLFNWLFARHNGGSFLVRIEDTDVARSKPEYVESILRSMAWMGLMPDEPVVYQLSRLAEHQSVVRRLIATGWAYPCFCEPKAADQVIHNLDQGQGSRYDKTCRDKTYTQEDLRRPHAIRFRVPETIKTVEFRDMVLGNVTVDVEQLDDFVILRRDGTPVYNFCVVIDDIFMRITHVIRGQDHISNTSKQLMLYRAVGVQAPQFAHIPLILGPHGGKLSKRDASVSVDEYRAQGFLSDALFNYLVRLGWSHGDQEVFTLREMVDYFSLDHVGRKGAVFDLKKLQWLNGVYLRNATADKLLVAIKDMDKVVYELLITLWAQDKLLLLLDLYKQRATTLREISDGISILAKETLKYNMQLLDKWRSPKTRILLSQFNEKLLTMDVIAASQLQVCAQAICEQEQEKLVMLAQPLRLALTGSVASPGVFELLEIVGKVRASERILRLLQQL